MSPRLRMILLTVAAALLSLGAGFVLRTLPLQRPQLLGWGFVFIASCVTTVRGILVLTKTRE